MSLKNREQPLELPESKLRFWLRLSWVVAYALMLVSMLNNLPR